MVRTSGLHCSWLSVLWLVLLVQHNALPASSQAATHPDEVSSRCLLQSGALETRAVAQREEARVPPAVEALKSHEIQMDQANICNGWQQDSGQLLRRVKTALKSASTGLKSGEKAQAFKAVQEAQMLLRGDDIPNLAVRKENLVGTTTHVQAAAQAQQEGLELARDYLNDVMKALTGKRPSTGAMTALGKVEFAERATTQAMMHGLRSCALGDVEKAANNLAQGLKEVKAGKRKSAMARVDNTIRTLKRIKKVVHYDMGIENLVQEHLDEAINELLGSTQPKGTSKVHMLSKSSKEQLGRALTKLKHVKYALHMSPSESSPRNEMLPVSKIIKD